MKFPKLNHKKQGEYLILGLILALALALRMYRIDIDEIWNDEAFSITRARESLWAIPAIIASQDPHPPLYYILLHFWMSIFGDSPFAARSLSAGFGVISACLIYVIGRQSFSGKVGLWAAALVAVAPFQIFYSQEARMYAPLGTFSLLSFYFFLSITRKPKPRHYVGYTITNACLLYTHYFGSFILFAQIIFVLSNQISRRQTNPFNIVAFFTSLTVSALTFTVRHQINWNRF